MFVKEDCEQILREEFDSENKSLLDEWKIYKQILSLKWKNKSKSFIRNKFVDRPIDWELVDWIISEIFTEWEHEHILKELAKMLKLWCFDYEAEMKDVLRMMDYKNKQKIFQKLVWKWFNFWDIKESLEIIENNYI